MPRLWILRHAKSSWDDASLADHDRPLAPRGRKACKALRRHCATAAVLPELVLCSTATRARETLAGVLPALGDPEVSYEEGALSRQRRGPGGAPPLARRGIGNAHRSQPGLLDLVATIARPGPLRDSATEKLPTGALATLDLDEWRDLGPGQATLIAYEVPRDLEA